MEGLLRLVLLFHVAVGQGSLGLGSSKIYSRPGHYPHIWCQISNALLSAPDATFYYRPGVDIDIHTDCGPLTSIWPIQTLKDTRLSPVCTEKYEDGYTFTIYYFRGGSNYFHLHRDAIIPLYQQLHYNHKDPPEKVVLMPTVEKTRLNNLDWDTDAFQSDSSYWMQLIRPLMKDNTVMMPLDRPFLNSSATICFKNLYIGTPRVIFEDTGLMQGYVRFMKSQLRILERPLTVHDLRIGIISRTSRRRILNEQNLMESVKSMAAVDLIRFEDFSVREQIALIQQYAVIIGMNGAGLMNALFRAQHAVAIQLVPYQAHLNDVQFGAMLATVGPYMVWHNKHKSLHRPILTKEGRIANSQGDTIVHVEELRQLVESALHIFKDAILDAKEEL